MQRLQTLRYSAESLCRRSVSSTRATCSSGRSLPSPYFRMSHKRTIRPRAHMAEANTCTITSFIAFGALVLAQQSSTEHVKCDDDAKDDGSESQSAQDCPFCRFFLDGPCRNEFIQWHTCVQTSEKATDCMDSFRPLKTCMDENEISMGEETNANEEASK